MKLKNELQKARDKKKAILAVEIFNYETLKGVIHAISRTDHPIILQATRSSISYLGLQNIVGLTEHTLAQHGVTGWLHLDQANSIYLVKDCLEAGFASVMSSPAGLTKEAYYNQTREIVKLAKKYGAVVEAVIMETGEADLGRNPFSVPAPGTIRKFVKETGIDAIQYAPHMGTKFSGSVPQIEVKYLKEISDITDTCVVLSGGPGLPDPVFIEAVRSGVCKVNIGDETEKTFMTALRKQMATSGDDDLRTVFSAAMEAIRTLIQSKLKLLTSASSGIS